MLFIYEDIDELSSYLTDNKVDSYIMIAINRDNYDNSFLAYQYNNDPRLLIEVLEQITDRLYLNVPKDD